MLNKNYDIIIAGAGLAGLTLLKNLIQIAKTEKRILIIDKSSKKTNDKTYSFWAKNEDLVKNIPFKKWNKYALDFNEGETIVKQFKDYKYFSINSLDYYNFVLNLAKNHNNLEFINDEVLTINEKNQSLNCKTNGSFSGKLIFNGLYNPTELKIEKPYTFLKQHFKGYVIKTQENNFEKDTMTIMDFRIDQNKEVHFFYILPENEKQALIEYTIFSENILEQKQYDQILKNYINQKLGINKFEILETEFGVIPMSDKKFYFRTANPNIFNIGTIGGFVKPSSGYSFVRVNQRMEKLVNTLLKNDYKISENFDLKSKFRHRLFDSILLSAMQQKIINTKLIFKRLYLNRNPNLVFQFLDEETTLLQELKIITNGPYILLINFFSRIIRFWKW